MFKIFQIKSEKTKLFNCHIFRKMQNIIFFFFVIFIIYKYFHSVFFCFILFSLSKSKVKLTFKNKDTLNIQKKAKLLEFAKFL